MPTVPISGTALALATALALGCNAQDATESTATEPGLAAPEPAAATGPMTASLPTPTAAALPDFDPKDFVRGVNNPLFPLPLGRRLI
jgi:hypothetical protein